MNGRICSEVEIPHDVHNHFAIDQPPLEPEPRDQRVVANDVDRSRDSAGPLMDERHGLSRENSRRV